MEYHKVKSLENLTCYDEHGNFIIEEWKNIDGLNDLYQISTFGRVKSYRYNKIISETKNHEGYITVKINKKNYRIHRLVAEMYIPKVMNKDIVNHKNKITSCNIYFNLEWCTVRENITHGYLTQIKTSKYTGVYFRKDTLKWCSNISINKKTVYLGAYQSEVEAHEAYQNKLKSLSI